MKKISLLLLAVFFLGKFSLGQALPPNEMRAHYINVGQANATLLEFSCGAILVDAGSQDASSSADLIRYLTRFFNRRTDLHKTLSLVIITHDHKDHNASLKQVAAAFKIKNYIDNGLDHGSGNATQHWMETQAQSQGIPYASVTYEQAAAVAGHSGLHTPVIDPVNCSGTDPDIRILSGAFRQLPAGWSADESRKNGNLHSLVVKVTFGQSSFLLTGDLEEKAMDKVYELYKNSHLLDADVWEVSHHGSYNGISQVWLQAITPKYAIISCAKWNDGINSTSPYNTYHYGHPRITALDMLQHIIPGNRPPLDSVVAFSGTREAHRNYKVTKNVYSTAWDGTIVLKAFTNGTYAFITP